MLRLVGLTCDSRTTPIDIGSQTPVLGFRVEENLNHALYQWKIQVALDSSFQTLVWDSGWRHGDPVAGIPYEGSPLSSMSRYFWRVLGRTEAGELCACAQTYFETTLLHWSDWRAVMIGQDAPVTQKCDHVIGLRRCFSLDSVPVRGRLCITAHGLYRAKINGRPVTDALLTPGFTTYHKNLLFQTYDVSALLQQGENKMDVLLAYGWYGRLGDWPGQAPYARQPAGLLAQLMMDQADGSRSFLCSDAAWEWRYSRIVSSNIYKGEIVAQAQPQVWRKVAVMELDPRTLHPHDGELVRCGEERKPVAQLRTPKGERVFDFGQNLSGFVRIQVKGKPGDAIRIRHGEVLDRDGNFYTKNLRSAQQVFSYTLDSDGEAVIAPQFTFFGFRYICVDAFPGQPGMENFTAVAIYSDMPQTLQFSCSDARMEALVRNTQWSMKSNCVDIPTDCPQRDERLGWTGDAYAFCDTAAYLMQTPRFFRKWLHDMAFNQHSDGAIPNTIPDMFNAYDTVTPENRSCCSAAGWAEAAIWCAYVQYLFFGDQKILEDCAPMMEAYLAYVAGRCKDGLLWEGDAQFGDWLALDAAEGSYRGATPEDFVSSAFHAGANRLMGHVCLALGRGTQRERYNARYEAIKAAFLQKYFDRDGSLQVKTQTACVLALQFALTPSPAKTAGQLAALIQAHDGHLTTGFLGTPFLCQALFDHGYAELAVQLLHQDTYPSWLYPVTMGATTIWEHWDGMKPDGSMWSEDMNSFNHYAYGSICGFIFSRLCGIRYQENEAGFARFTIAPYFVPQWDYCALRYHSIRGEIAVNWRRAEGGVQVRITVPGNSRADLVLPGEDKQVLEPGDYQYFLAVKQRR